MQRFYMKRFDIRNVTDAERHEIAKCVDLIESEICKVKDESGRQHLQFCADIMLEQYVSIFELELANRIKTVAEWEVLEGNIIWSQAFLNIKIRQIKNDRLDCYFADLAGVFYDICTRLKDQ